MSRFIKEYISVYYLLYFFSFLSIYFYTPAVSFFSLLILVASYYLLISKLRFDVVIALIFYSRCLNGFVFAHNSHVFFVVSLLTGVVPTLLYFSIVLSKNNAGLSKSIFSTYKYTFLFFLILTVSFVYNFQTSYDLISKRYLPFSFFILFLVGFTNQQNLKAEKMLHFFRAVFISSIFVFLFSNYLPLTRGLLESDSVFGVSSSSNAFSYTSFSFVRNIGFVWDPRILAILAYLYLLLAIIQDSKFLRLDILLSGTVAITTLSRGGILTYCLILLVYFFIVARKSLAIAFIVGFLTLVGALIFSSFFFTDTILEFLQSFNPVGNNNALSQRSVFASYALDSFRENPVFGKGVGFLTSNLIDRSILVDGEIVTVVGDAFWYILLGEMGIVGFIFYILFLSEVFLSRKLLNVALFFGFIVQLLGTDIPDMRFFYYAVLVTVLLIKNSLESKTKIKA